MNIAIITSGFLPVPATKGGAVENLIENFINKNEDEKYCNFTIFSEYEERAVEEAKRYKNSNIIFIKSNLFVDLLDKLTFMFAKYILRKTNSHSYRFIFRRINYLNKVSIYLKNNMYDKVILENHPTQYLALKWRDNYKKYKDKYYYHCHNEFTEFYGCKDIINNTKMFISVSEYISKSLQKTLNKSGNQFKVLRNGIDQEKFNIYISEVEKEELQKKYNIQKNEKVLIFTGRVVPEKGVKELLESLKKVKSTNYKLLVVGSALNDIKTKTQYQLEVENIVNTLRDKVVFTGFIKYVDIAKLYKIADIAVLPSIWDDPAPLTVIESLVCGLPIISTQSGGIPEYAMNGAAFLLKRDHNLIENLAKSIDELIKNEKKCKEMSKISFELSKKLTIDNYCNDFSNLLGCEKSER